MTVDLVVLALVALGAVFGARAGASRQLASWGALVVAALAARPGGALSAQRSGGSSTPRRPWDRSRRASPPSSWWRWGCGWWARGCSRESSGSDPAERGTDRALGGLLGAGKVAAVAWVALSALAFVEANVQVAGKGLGLSPKDSTAFAIARRWNLFSAPFFSRAADLAAAEKVFRSPELFQRVAEDPAVSALEKNPRFRAVFVDPEVKEALDRGDTVALLRNASVHRLLQDPEALAQLAKLREVVEQVQQRGPTNPVAPRPTRVK
jgi:membrane protein required for colicin V production